MLWRILAVFVGALVALSVYEGEKAHHHSVREAAQSGAHHPHKPMHKRVVHHLPSSQVASSSSRSSMARSFRTRMGCQQRIDRIADGQNAPLGAILRSRVDPSSTYDIVKASMEESLFFGTGQTVSAKVLIAQIDGDEPHAILGHTFDFGLGRIPTYFGTTGLIGTILWLVFVILLMMKARHIIRLFAKDRIASYLATSLFLLTLYFWSIAFFYLPNIAIFALAFLFTGALIAFLVGEGVLGQYKVAFVGNSRLTFVITPITLIVLIGVTAAGVLLYRQTASLVAYHDAQAAIQKGDLDAAATAIMHANELSERDLYLRTMSNIALVRLSRLLPHSSLLQNFRQRLIRSLSKHVPMQSVQSRSIRPILRTICSWAGCTIRLDRSVLVGRKSRPV